MNITWSLIAKLVGALALIGLGFGLGYKFERGDVVAAQAELTSYKAQVARAVADQAKKTADEIAKRDQISQSIAQLYTQQIAQDKEKDREKTSVASHITCAYDGLRDTGPAGSAHLRTVPGAAGEPDAATLDTLSAGLPEQCRDTTRQLEDLQLEECKQLAVSGEHPDYCKRFSH